MTETSRPTVQEAIINVKRAIGAVGKDRKIEQGPAKYNYRGIDAILDAAHDALVDEGLLVVPVQAVPSYEMRATRNGDPMQWVSLVVDWLVMGPAGDVLLCDVPEINPTTGELVMVKRPPQTIGEAADTSDKATNKAHTAAWKILLSELFAIPFSADEQDASRLEHGHGVARGAPPARWTRALREQAEALQESLDNLPTELYRAAIDRMTARAREKGRDIEDFGGVADLGPEWVPVWDRLLAKAWETAEASQSDQVAPPEAEPAPDDPTLPEPAPEPTTGHTGAVSRGTAEPEPDRAGLPTTWDAIMALSPSQLAKTLVDNGWGTSGSKNTQRRRLASKLAIEIPADAGTGER